ncbi:MAG: COG1615 family transporter [Synechococcaceae cyanobacterium RL_1_2]|nr:COG1615 family transporter [Synechococcaceae cyanobacterium RL_1_2]
MIGLGISTIIFLARPVWLMTGLAIVQSLIFTAILSAQWGRIFLWSHPSKFFESDPLFGEDIGFYVFTLPGLQLMDFWFEGLCFFGLIGITFTYILANNSLSEGKFAGFSLAQLRHLWIMAGLFMFALSLSHWLNRYELLYSQQGVVSYGAGFTDVRINLPAENLLMMVTAGIGIWLFYQGLWGTSHRELDRDHQPTEVKLIFSYVVLLTMAIAIAYGVQRLNVQPNELDKESPYLARSIEYTRKGFGLQNIETKVFDPEDKLTRQDLLDNYLTVDNIRLWDSRPILRTNRQLQQLRLYYSFPDADVDRYYFSRNPLTNETTKAGLEERQIIISARELNYPSVPERAQTWVNEHLVYTHGYGFTMSPVHNVDDNGLPYYYVQDISSRGDDSLETVSDTVREAIDIKNPRIYYGELTNTYVMTPSTIEEFDYPRGETNVYNTYDGRGGSTLGVWPRRLLWSQYFKDVRMLFANNITPRYQNFISTQY